MAREPLVASASGDARNAVTPEEIATLVLFAQLPAPDRESIAPHFRHRAFTAGQHVIEHHDRSFELFFVLAGRLRVVLYSPAGRDVSFRDLLPGAVFGELAAIDGGFRSATVVANETTRLAVLSGADFLALTRAHPAVNEILLHHLVALIRRYSARVYELSTLRVEERIRLELLRLAYPSADAEGRALLCPAPTLAELASRVSTTREAVSREIARLGREGLLERRDDDLLIPDLGRLNATVESLPG